MSTRFARPLAWGMWALSLGLTALALRLDPALAADELAFLAFPTVGALVASRRPANPVGWLFCALGVPLGVERIAKAYATYALVTHPGAVPGGPAVAWLATWPWVTVVGLLARAAGFTGEIREDGQASSRSAGVGWMRADIGRADRVLGWVPKYDLASSVEAVWAGE